MSKFKPFIPSRCLTTSLAVMLTALLAVGYSPVSQAGATFKIDDTRWLSIGMGLRTSYRTVENGAGYDNSGFANGQWSNVFSIDNMRFYFNAQLHKYIKVEVNTECQTCNNGGQVRILDAIGKLEVNPMVNLWIGRMLVPAERRELNGPFFSAVYNIFYAGTPFEPSDFNSIIKTNGSSAGSFGRSDGGTFWGAFLDGRLQYAVGFFRGLIGGANYNDNVLYAQRISYNFWNVEKNPGYYTSGTYYGKGGDILTLAVSNQYQSHGAGTRANPANFRGTAVDLLMEKVLDNEAVVTVNSSYKNYATPGLTQATRDALASNPSLLGFGMFDGNAYSASAMYLFPQTVGIGQLQPFVRYVGVRPNGSANRSDYEAGVNYVIDGHNAMISLTWDYGDLITKGLNYSSTATGAKVNSLTLGFQWQI